jgi:hypothetical protein
MKQPASTPDAWSFRIVYGVARPSRLDRVVGLVGGKLEVEGRPLALGALEPHPPTVRLDDRARDGEAEAGASDGARVRRPNAEEAREDLVLLVSRDADASVSDLDAGAAVGSRCADVDLAASR